jgi:hypothetical protein
VGVEPLDQKWRDEVRVCVEESGSRRARLWSLEVKTLINRSNVRECFFQAVSNSSWANFGYLVADEIEEKAEAELQMLTSAHGIGLIRLSKDDLSESEIVFPAKERQVVDWESANRLAEANPDFRGFLKLVRQFYQTGDIKPADWPEPSVDGKA